MIKVIASTVSNDLILSPSVDFFYTLARHSLPSSHRGLPALYNSAYHLTGNHSTGLTMMFVIGIAQWETYWLLARMSAW
jgi:hypothetical protein